MTEADAVNIQTDETEEMLLAWTVPALNTLADAISVWREAKGFHTPHDIAGPISGRHLESGRITNADLMLSKLMLVTTEVSEAAEAVRRGDRENFAEELADAVIRILDIAGTANIDLAQVLAGVMVRNLNRPTRHGKVA